MAALSNICKRFEDQTVLDDLTLDLNSHAITALVGPSGCGKSTLLRIAAGLLGFDSGEVNADRSRIGVVFQEPRLLPWLTVAENLALALPSGAEDKTRRIAAALAAVRLEECENKFPRQLSGGMAQRVAIARALLSEPELLLMDEPFAALDAITRAELQQVLIRLVADKQLNCLFVTHDLQEAELISNRLVVMHRGAIACSYEKHNSRYPDEMSAGVHHYLNLR